MENRIATLRGVSNLEGPELQLSADSGDTTDVNNQGVEQLNDNDKQESKTYTQEEVDKLLQSGS